jgi:hypothetical protein
VPTDKVEPFVLKHKQLRPPEAAPRHYQVYDSELQLWIDANSGEPLVNRRFRRGENPLSCSEFGETTLNKKLVLAAACEQSLPAGDVEGIETVESVKDPDDTRCARERTFLENKE